MAYDFKRLGDVTVVDTVADEANILIEENGVIKKANKSQIGDKISTAALVESVTEDANVIVEENGVIKKVNKSQIGMSEVSWDDLTDKPFDSNVEIIEIFPEQTVYYSGINNEDDRYYIYLDNIESLNANSIYIAVLNGQKYEAVPGQYGVEFDYNLHMYSGSYGTTAQWKMELGESVTLAIYEKKEEVVKQLDTKFLKGKIALDMLDYESVPDDYLMNALGFGFSSATVANGNTVVPFYHNYFNPVSGGILCVSFGGDYSDNNGMIMQISDKTYPIYNATNNTKLTSVTKGMHLFVTNGIRFYLIV